MTADRAAVWRVLTDPDMLPQLTPLLHRIDADGEHWRWHMVRLAVMGVGIRPVFTERMTFTEGTRIDFTHAPPSGVTEWAGAEGYYALADAEPDTDGVPGTHLEISLTLDVDLPLSRLAAPVVTRTMRATMDATGDRFAANLLRHLDARPR
ncbi:SRPBCC family protein [Pseudonocardia sp. HH130630-07]|uniref:SRPBCC family protein n=1 Tax=Pseudonocardia sp. HH130630-07 TaxID=1690815 RepID=UPI000814D350|nr:SRPBCC family protein [Pseudonocardia sp. HH130630-07]ANY09150.1 hypothetical protein AFB00_26110 [Pseudonocardia sp. HH130630-07]